MGWHEIQTPSHLNSFKSHELRASGLHKSHNINTERQRTSRLQTVLGHIYKHLYLQHSNSYGEHSFELSNPERKYSLKLSYEESTKKGLESEDINLHEVRYTHETIAKNREGRLIYWRYNKLEMIYCMLRYNRIHPLNGWSYWKIKITHKRRNKTEKWMKQMQVQYL